jgi:hypothetical protein
VTVVTTIRELIQAGFDIDKQIFVRRDDEDDTAYDTIPMKATADSPGDPDFILLDLDDSFVMIADETNDDGETESDYQARKFSGAGSWTDEKLPGQWTTDDMGRDVDTYATSEPDHDTRATEGDRVLSFDEAEAAGFDGTGCDGDPRFPYHASDLPDAPTFVDDGDGMI